MININSGSLIFAGIGVVIAASALYGFTQSTGTPQIEVTPASYDFGSIEPELVNHTFTVKNTGGAPLLIKRVSTSCGCTKATIDSEEIAPGQTTDMLVTFDPNLMEGGVEGDVLRVVYIKSNDLENPEVEIEITANVI
jgi:hypothetical protein